MMCACQKPRRVHMARFPFRISTLVDGVSCIVFAAMALALGDALVKFVSNDLSVWQLVVARAIVAVPLLVLCVAGRGLARLWPQRVGWVALRSLLLVAMWLLVYLALASLSLPVVSAALYSAPLLITLFSGLRPGRRLAKTEIAAVVFGFIGVLVLLRPGTSAFSPTLWLPLTGAVFYALAAMLTATRCRHESPWALAFGLQVVFFIVGSAGLLAVMTLPIPAGWADAVPFVATGWRLAPGDAAWAVVGLIAALAVIAVSASAAMGRAYQIAPAPRVAAGDYSYLVFATLWSVLLFEHWPGPWRLAGTAMIIVAGMVAIRSGASDTRADDTPVPRRAGAR